MLRILDEATVASVGDPMVRVLIEERIGFMADGDDFDPDVHGFFVIADVSDRLEAVEAAIEAPLLTHPGVECIEHHPGWLEVVLIPDTGDFGVVVFIPDHPDIDPRLRDFCDAYDATSHTED